MNTMVSHKQLTDQYKLSEYVMHFIIADIKHKHTLTGNKFYRGSVKGQICHNNITHHEHCSTQMVYARL